MRLNFYTTYSIEPTACAWYTFVLFKRFGWRLICLMTRCPRKTVCRCRCRNRDKQIYFANEQERRRTITGIVAIFLFRNPMCSTRTTSKHVKYLHLPSNVRMYYYTINDVHTYTHDNRSRRCSTRVYYIRIYSGILRTTHRCFGAPFITHTVHGIMRVPGPRSYCREIPHRTYTHWTTIQQQRARDVSYLFTFIIFF